MSSKNEETGTTNETQQSDGGADITPFPIRKPDPDDQESEYLVDIDTHHSILVVALNAEEAVAKAILTENDDEERTVVGHDVHVCVHSGISDNECDHEEKAE